jgi:hypothetical protein
MTDLTRIIQDLEQQREAIDRALAALRDIGGSGRAAAKGAANAADAPRKRQMSAAGRKAISEATKRRWAATRAAAAAPAATKTTVAKKSGGKKAAVKNAARAAKNAGKSNTP